jgi:hypothetical protein
MGLTSNINLIKKPSGLPEYLVPLENQYRNFSILTLFIVFLAGVLTVVGFLIFQIQVQNVTRQKNIANRKLETLKPKENLYLAIKSRIGVVDSVIKSSHQKSILITDATTVANPPKLIALSEGADKKLRMNYKCDSVEDCISMANTILVLYQDKKLKDVMMDNFSIDPKGISMSFYSTPVWPE